MTFVERLLFGVSDTERLAIPAMSLRLANALVRYRLSASCNAGPCPESLNEVVISSRRIREGKPTSSGVAPVQGSPSPFLILNHRSAASAGVLDTPINSTYPSDRK